jgi:Family of unknown function (DUF5681)
MPFVKGQSGNPAGRPAGSPNKYTAEMQEALEESGLPLIQRLLELAGQGNTGAMRQCLDRLMGKHKPSSVRLPAPDSPNYVIVALTEIHRALGAGEIASDEAARLVDFVGRTARVLAAKAVAEIDIAAQLARIEDALGLLLNAGNPAAQTFARVAAAGAHEPASAAGAIDNNNAESMTLRAPDAAEPVVTPPAELGSLVNNNEITREVADALDEAVRATLPPRRESVKDRLMNSASPSALLIGDITEKVLAGQTESVVPPLAPPARAA